MSAGATTSRRVAHVVGSALGVAFEALGRLRADKPIHPRGVVASARLVRHGDPARPSGVPWLDDPGVDVGIARFSRSVGLPGPLPDVLGMAVRFDSADGPRDLLLATTGLRRGLRHLLVPRRRPLAASYGSLMPYDAAGRQVVLAAIPSDPHRTATTERDLADELERRPVVFRLYVARLLGDWRWFGTLELSRQPGAGAPVDARIHFDPVRNSLPALPIVAGLRELRAPSYPSDRGGRHTVGGHESGTQQALPVAVGAGHVPGRKRKETT